MSEAYHVDGLRELARALEMMGGRQALQVAKAALRDAAGEIRKEMRSSAPMKKGVLRSSIKVVIDNRAKDSPAVFVGSIGRQGWYARFIERGTRPHRIPVATVGRGTTRRANQVRLSFGGRVVASVDHPGIAPRPWAEPAFMRSYPRALEKLKQRLAERIIVETYRKARVRR